MAHEVLDEVEFAVERGKISELAKATFVADPVHHDPSAAADRGFSAPPATPTYVVVAGHQRDQAKFVRDLGLDISRIVVGSVRWTYHRPLVAGDELHGTRRVLSRKTITNGQGQQLTLVDLETNFTDPTGEVLVTVVEQLIERPAA